MTTLPFWGHGGFVQPRAQGCSRTGCRHLRVDRRRTRVRVLRYAPSQRAGGSECVGTHGVRHARREREINEGVERAL